MTEPNPISTQQKDEKSTARVKKYLSYIESYPLFSILLVLKDYEDEELYEECAIIRDALTEYRTKYSKLLPEGRIIPKHISEYTTKSHQKMLHELGIIVDVKVAREKAKLIKLKLPIDGIKL